MIRRTEGVMEAGKSRREKIISNQRKARRVRYTSVIGFLIEGRTKQTNFGMTLDVSATGFSFYSPILLNEGQKITVQTYSFTLPCQEAVVVWKRKLNEDLYAFGMEFLAK